MRRMLAVAILTLTASSLAFAQGAGKAEDEILKLERESAEFVKRGDTAALTRYVNEYYADDYVGIHPEGTVTTKARELEAVKAGGPKFDTYDYDEVKTRVYGGTAVFTGRLTIKGQFNGQDVSAQFRVVEAWVKRGGKWRSSPHRVRASRRKATPESPLPALLARQPLEQSAWRGAPGSGSAPTIPVRR